MRRGQSMSFDAIAATFLFILVTVFASIYAFNFFAADIGVSLSADANTLGETIVRDLSVRAVGTDRTQIDERRLLAMIERGRDDYEAFRASLGVTSDFCVFFEEEDGSIAAIFVRDAFGDLQPEFAFFGSNEVFLGDTGIRCGGI